MAPGDGDDADIAALFGAQVPGMPDKPPPAPAVDEENPSGGSMFKKLMERAKEGPSRPPLSQPEPQMQMQPPAPPQPQALDSYATYQAQLQAWQQQMTAFAQFSTSNPEAASQMTMPPPPQPPVPGAVEQQVQPPAPDVEVDGKSKNAYDYLPKGDGRNNHSFEVNNAADVYFAQLKRDSSVRLKARKAGDIEKSNKVFEDEGVKALTNILSEELIASRREQVARSGGEFETSRDEMFLPAHFISEEEPDKTDTGISYRERLRMAREAKSGKKGTQATQEPVAAAPAPAPAPAEKSKIVPEVKAFNLGSDSQAAPPAEKSKFVPEVKAFNLAPTTPEPVAAESFTMASTAPESVSSEAEEQSQPNFALAVKNENEIETIAAPSMEDSEEARRSVRTLMGLLLKHRGGAGFGHGRLQGPEANKLEDTALDVLSLLNEESGNTNTITAKVAAPPVQTETPQMSLSPLTGAIACVDAAVNMYKSADSAGQEELILPVRDALLSAVNTINRVIAEEELKSAKGQATSESEPTLSIPVKTQSEEEEVQEIVNVIANASEQSTENTERLQKAYDSLKAVTGNKKFGLRDDLSPEEISNTRDAIVDMRGALMDEL